MKIKIWCEKFEESRMWLAFAESDKRDKLLIKAFDNRPNADRWKMFTDGIESGIKFLHPNAKIEINYEVPR